MDINDLITIRQVKAMLPAIFTRSSVPSLFGGVISAGTLANLGKSGPPYSILNGHATYERDTFVDWLLSRTEKRL